MYMDPYKLIRLVEIAKVVKSAGVGDSVREICIDTLQCHNTVHNVLKELNDRGIVELERGVGGKRIVKGVKQEIRDRVRIFVDAAEDLYKYVYGE